MSSGVAAKRLRRAWLRNIGPQLAAVALLALFSVCAAWLMDVSRACMVAESNWSRAQRQAAFSLLRYSRNGSQHDLTDFYAAVDVTLGDRVARLEMDKPDYNREVVVDGFTRGGNHPSDISGMITLYRWFRWLPTLREAVTLWAEGDRQIDLLMSVAREMRREGSTLALEERTLAIHHELGPLEAAFSRNLLAAARHFFLVVLVLQTLGAIALMLLASQVSRQMASRARRAESALHNVTERLETVMQGSTDGHWDWDAEKKKMFVTPRFKRHLGYDDAQTDDSTLLTELTNGAAIHPEDVPNVRAAVARLLASREKTFNLDLRLRTQRGDYRWFNARGMAMHNAANPTRRISGAITDVHERTLAQAALSNSSALNRGLFEAALDAIVVVDGHGLIRFINPAVEKIFGYTPAEVLGRSITVLQPDNPGVNGGRGRSFQSAMQAASEHRLNSHIQIMGRRKSGQEFPVEFSFSEMRVSDDRLFAAFVRDVSVSTESRKALEQSMALLDATQTVARVGGWEVDVTAGDRVFWTRQMYAMLDLSPATFIPTETNTLQFFAPEARATMQQIVSDAIEYQKTHDVEVEMITATGRRIWVHSRGHVTIEDGQTIKRTSTVRDITQRKKSELEQRAALRRQEQMAAELDLALRGAQVALWSFEPETGRITQVRHWEIFGHAFMPSTYEEWKSLVHPEDLSGRVEAMDRYMAGETETDEAEFRLRTGRGDWVWVRSRGQMVGHGADGKPLLYAGMIMDISAQVAARQVVNDQLQFLESMVEGVDTGVMISTDARVVYANVSFRRTMGLPAAELAAEFYMESLFSPADWEREQRRRQSLTAGVAVPSAVYDLISRSGEPVQVALNLSRVMWNGEPHFINTMTPLTEHAMLQLQLEATHRRFERVLISELEAQQAQIARELHDSLGSELAALSLIIGGMKVMTPPDAPLARHLNQALAQITSSAEVARGLARGLMPVGGHAGAFWRALERLASDLGKVQGVTCDFTMQGDLDNIAADVGSHLYRIAQEAVANAIRHGKASRLAIRLEQTGRRFTMWVRDNGGGFEPARGGSEGSGLGLRSMRARAKALDGQIQFLRGTMGGCDVKVTWSASPATGQPPQE